MTILFYFTLIALLPLIYDTLSVVVYGVHWFEVSALKVLMISYDQRDSFSELCEVIYIFSAS